MELEKLFNRAHALDLKSVVANMIEHHGCMLTIEQAEDSFSLHVIIVVSRLSEAPPDIVAIAIARLFGLIRSDRCHRTDENCQLVVRLFDLEPSPHYIHREKQSFLIMVLVECCGWFTVLTGKDTYCDEEQVEKLMVAIHKWIKKYSCESLLSVYNIGVAKCNLPIDGLLNLEELMPHLPDIFFRVNYEKALEIALRCRQKMLFDKLLLLKVPPMTHIASTLQLFYKYAVPDNEFTEPFIAYLNFRSPEFRAWIVSADYISSKKISSHKIVNSISFVIDTRNICRGITEYSKDDPEIRKEKQRILRQAIDLEISRW